MRGIPYERFSWIANSFPIYDWNSPQFENMICLLANGGVPTVMFILPARAIVVCTWQKVPANA